VIRNGGNIDSQIAVCITYCLNGVHYSTCVPGPQPFGPHSTPCQSAGRILAQIPADQSTLPGMERTDGSQHCLTFSLRQQTRRPYCSVISKQIPMRSMTGGACCTSRTFNNIISRTASSPFSYKPEEYRICKCRRK